MTVLVTKFPGGISQIINPATGKITYKSKIDEAYLKIDAFNGIVRFTKKGAKATVSGPNITTEDCEIIEKDDPNYGQALQNVVSAQKKYNEDLRTQLDQELSDLES